MPKTRSNVNGALVSDDYFFSALAGVSVRWTYLKGDCVIPLKVDYRLSAIRNLDFVLRPEAGNNCEILARHPSYMPPPKYL